MKGCLFCKIINKEISADIVFENGKFLVFKDIYPKAPVHLLLVTKKHIRSVNDLKLRDKSLIGELFLLVPKVAARAGVKKSGYKLVFNVGRGGGQMIEHLHLHLLAGWKNEKESCVPGMP